MEVKTFINYYEVLQVNPSANSETIERKFRHLARRYHPDNQATGDRSQFDAIVEAHNTLKDAVKRAQYHEDHQYHLPPLAPSAAEERSRAKASDTQEREKEVFVDGLGIDQDISIQNNILILLYLQRRRNIREPGIGNAELERLSACPPEHLEFHIWYLKAKGWVSTGEDGLLAISVQGVDRAAALFQEGAKLITDQS